jgi:L-glyceraldehyde 3-phosphate reductase
MLRRAFDLSITHFDLANNYGPPPGSAEETFSHLFRQEFRPYRDELIISTKAGWGMWDGPYGDFGSRKYLIASLDQSLQRMGLDYVDIYYHHRPDPETPLEETMGALDHVVRQGKALYAAISNYDAEQTRQATAILRDLGTPCLINQVSYSMLNRWIEPALLDAAADEGIGLMIYSPLHQGMLTDRYLEGIPVDSRAAKAGAFLQEDRITPEYLATVRGLNEIANQREQTLAQMALAWVLRHEAVTSVLVGASTAAQVEENVALIDHLDFSQDKLDAIEALLYASL